ncbi:hypothetical protein Dimus_024853 [Dionaea muscipula]
MEATTSHSHSEVAASVGGGGASWSSKRLQFDRRYGWVFDEWRDPAEEALSGGRGMFCIVPLAKGLYCAVSHSISAAASTSIKVLERPDLLSPQQLQASIRDQFHCVLSSVKIPKLNMLMPREKSFSPPLSDSLHPDSESGDLQESESD